VLQGEGRKWKRIEDGGVLEDRRCLAVNDPHKSGGVEGIEIRRRRRRRLLWKIGYSSMAVHLTTETKILTPSREENYYCILASKIILQSADGVQTL
jgi:hypothetical protein